MKILIHSNAPWVPSGYGKQCRLLLENFSRRGHDEHEVVVSAFSGLHGAPLSWAPSEYDEPFRILPSGRLDFGVDMLGSYIAQEKPDLTLLLMDAWKLGPVAEQLKSLGTRIAAWLPVDCTPLSKVDEAFLRFSDAVPIAMTRWGQQRLDEAGFSPYEIPHMVDPGVFFPLGQLERVALRRELGVADRFVVGICAANQDAIRKGFPEQFEAFARFRKRHPEALLAVHTMPQSALDLVRLAYDLGISDAVHWSDPFAQMSGAMDDKVMADWYRSLDVLAACSYAEGFGVPVAESLYCGTPVLVTDGTAAQEVAARLDPTRRGLPRSQGGVKYSVAAQPFWNPVHHAWWQRPDIESIVEGLEEAHGLTGDAGRVFSTSDDFHKIEVFDDDVMPVLRDILEEDPATGE